MPEIVIGYIGILFLLVSILLGAPIMIALTAVGFVGLVMLTNVTAAISILGTIYFSVVNGFHFSVIPMFLLMGFFALRAGIGNDLFDASTKWLGRLPGGLALATMGAASAFGAASGSSVGSASLFTKLALPEMVQRGYDRGFGAATIAIAGTLAVLIPPSALMVVYGILTDSSIGRLLVAGVLPGIVFSILLAGTVIAVAVLNPEKAPPNERRYTWKERFYSLRMVGPLIAVILIMLGGLYGGVFTPTEAGGVGALVTFTMALIRQRGFRGLQIGRTLLETVTLTAMIFAIIIGGLLFARFLALSGVSGAIKDILVSGQMSVWMVVALVTAVYLIFGMLMDAPSLLAISLPITYPVMTGLGFDPLWFGVYVIILAEIGAVTPPVGINCFVVKGAAGSLVSLEQIFRGLMPFIFACLLMLVAMLVFPQLALILPSSMR
jgi:tripartite ATP-independent transporter DctM subunit